MFPITLSSHLNAGQFEGLDSAIGPVIPLMDRLDQQLQALGVEKKPFHAPLMRLFDKCLGIAHCEGSSQDVLDVGRS